MGKIREVKTFGSAGDCLGCSDPVNHPHAFDCERA